MIGDTGSVRTLYSVSTLYSVLHILWKKITQVMLDVIKIYYHKTWHIFILFILKIFIKFTPNIQQQNFFRFEDTMFYKFASMNK